MKIRTSKFFKDLEEAERFCQSLPENSVPLLVPSINLKDKAQGRIPRVEGYNVHYYKKDML